MNVLAKALTWFDWFVVMYFLILNSTYLVLVMLATVDITQYRRRDEHAGLDDVFANSLTPTVAVVLPAHNEEAVIVESVRATLGLRYPSIEVIVVDDGSTDSTFECLLVELDLVEIPAVVPNLVPVLHPVESVWIPREGDPVVVVRKQAGGSKVDAVNAGINLASAPIVCITDADAVLDPDALLKVVKPFLDDPLRVVGSGGTVRAVNGSVVERGRVVDARMPRGWLPRIQVVEYLRAFLLGRLGWSRLRALVIISGAFGVFRRDVLVKVGGFAAGAIGEDAELVTRVHRTFRDEGREYRFAFVAEPVCWTEVPSTLHDLGSQRRRWSRGIGEMLWKHRRMIGNPKYGTVGTLALPHFLAFEVLGPVVELVGLVTLVPAVVLGLVDVELALLLLLVAIGYGVLVSLACVTIEELTYHRFTRWSDLGAIVVAAAIENVGYRQLHTWWRLRGLIQLVSGREAAWGHLPRSGFQPRARGA